MGLKEEIAIIAIGYAFTYLVPYQINKLLGNLMFMGLSIAMMATSTDNTMVAVGGALFLGSFATLIYTIIKKTK